MNKMVKMPLFLGVTGAACAVVLASVYALTNPIITANKLEKANAAYISMYSSYSIAGTDVEDVEVSDELFNAGCTTKVVIAKAQGACYTVSTKGYAGTFTFQIAFAEGKYLGYTDLGNSETGAYGGAVIGSMNDLVNGKDASQGLTSYADFNSLISGKSTTGKPLASAVEACRKDYMSMSW